MTQAAAEVSVSHVSNMERGRDAPSAAVLRKLAAALGLSYNELAVLAVLADPAEGLDAEAAADGAWFARLPAEQRRWLRRVAATWPG